VLINYTKLLKIKYNKKRKRDSSCGPVASGLAGLVATRAAEPACPPPCSLAGLPPGARPSTRGSTPYKRATVRVWTLTAAVHCRRRQPSSSSHHLQPPPPSTTAITTARAHHDPVMVNPFPAMEVGRRVIRSSPASFDPSDNCYEPKMDGSVPRWPLLHHSGASRPLPQSRGRDKVRCRFATAASRGGHLVLRRGSPPRDGAPRATADVGATVYDRRGAAEPVFRTWVFLYLKVFLKKVKL
jgi:hypothetical protein